MCPESGGGCGHPVAHHDDEKIPLPPTSLGSLQGTLQKAQEWVAEVPDPLADADLLSEAAASVAPSVAPSAATTIPGRPVPERLHLGQRLVVDEDEVTEYKDYSAQVSGPWLAYFFSGSVWLSSARPMARPQQAPWP